jgi:hypothetical protein
MRKVRQIKRVGIKISLPQKIRQLKNGEIGSKITFVMNDNSKVIETLSESFLNNKKINQIINDLYAITHDKGAKHFII